LGESVCPFPKWHLELFRRFYTADPCDQRTDDATLRLKKKQSVKDVRRYFFSQRVVNRWNSLDQETVAVGSINSFKGRLDKIRKTRMGFYGLCMVRKALGLMEMGPP